jgi:D-galactarolactone isomerase
LKTMRALDSRRVRGARFYLEKGPTVDAQALIAFSRKALEMDWHIEIQPSRGDTLVSALDLIDKLQCPVVIDHLGYTPQPDGIRHPAAFAMKHLLDSGHVWIKLSGLYFTSVSGFPDYEDVDELASQLMKHRPDRMLWGTDWPHSGEKDRKPDDSKLLDQTARWSSLEADRRAMLVENPARLYWGH